MRPVQPESLCRATNPAGRCSSPERYHPFRARPQTSALDVNCKAHEVDNLYVVDGSFFPSSAAVNPALTIMANAMRVGDHILERMGATTTHETAEMSRAS